MKRIILYIDQFFFRQISASGFGLMRIAWAATILLFMLGNAENVVRFYSSVGIFPEGLNNGIFRNEYRFSILSIVRDPLPVFLLWSFFLCSLTFMMLGIRTRIATIISVLLLFSFNEHLCHMVNAGDNLLRAMGFILMISPRIDAFSLDSLRRSFLLWRKGRLPIPIQMSIWPYRLLLWQLIIVYLASVWEKWHSVMWLNGAAVAIVYHMTEYFRWSKSVADNLSGLSPYVSRSWMIFGLLWGLLLIPREFGNIFVPSVRKHSLKRWILLLGVGFHGGMLILMDTGAFQLVIFSSYLGLLVDEDFQVLREFFSKRWTKAFAKISAPEASASPKITVLYDGSCSLCRRSVFFLLSLDALQRLRIINFRDEKLRKRYAPDIKMQRLERALHIRFPDSKASSGFDAFKILARHLPALWWSVPLLHLPFAASIGRSIYSRIARNRHICSGKTCVHKL